MKYEEAGILNLAEGSAVEKFNVELANAIADIRDLNKDPKKARKVTLKVCLWSDDDRQKIQLSVEADCKLVADKPTIDMLHLTRDKAFVPAMHQLGLELNQERDGAVALFDKEKSSD